MIRAGIWFIGGVLIGVCGITGAYWVIFEFEDVTQTTIGFAVSFGVTFLGLFFMARGMTLGFGTLAQSTQGAYKSLNPSEETSLPPETGQDLTSWRATLLLFFGLFIAFPIFTVISMLTFTLGLDALDALLMERGAPEGSAWGLWVIVFVVVIASMPLLRRGWHAVRGHDGDLSWREARQQVLLRLVHGTILGLVFGSSFAITISAIAYIDGQGVHPVLLIPISFVIAPVVFTTPVAIMTMLPPIWLTRVFLQGDHERTLRHIRRVRYINPIANWTPGVYPLLEAQALFLAARYAEAETLLQDLIQQTPQARQEINQEAIHSSEYYQLGNLFGLVQMEQGDFDEAIRLLEASIEIQPKSAEAYDSLAEVLLRRGDPADAPRAIELLDQALAHHTQAPGAFARWLGEMDTTLTYRTNQAWAYALNDQPERARLRLEEVEHALDSEQPNPVALADLHYRLGRAYALLGEPATARAYFERVIHSDPDGRSGILARAAIAEVSYSA